MRCSGYCTTIAYDIATLSQQASALGAVQLYRDVSHIQSKDLGVKRDIFCFPYGAIIFWGFSEEEEKTLLQTFRKFEKEAIPKMELDEFQFAYGDKTKVEDDVIVLQKKDALTKLSISYAIAQSVKLTVFEGTVFATIESTKRLPTELSLRGKIPLSRKETSRKMGELFLERNYINLHTDMLDTPEFFWDHSELEPHYRRMFQYLDVGKRIELLNRRLTLMHELYEILGNELNHQQSSRLEMTIIILIVIEVLMGLLRDVFHWI